MIIVKKILLNIAVVAVIVFVLDFSIGKMLRYFYFTEKSGLHFRSTYAIDSTKADILIFGSSRANHHYVPEIFEDSLKMSFYNTGRDGNSILYSLAVFKSITERYTPKIIILDLMTDELNYNSQSYDRLSSLQPYYVNHPEIRPIVNLRGPYEKFKLYSAIYPFNSNLLTIMIGNMDRNKKRKEDRKGYIPLLKCMNNTAPITLDDHQTNFDLINIAAIKFICNACTSKNIQLFIVQSPLYAKLHLTASADLMKKITNENKVPFLNYVNDTVFMWQTQYFQDISHLNDEGATRFSSIIAQRIKTMNSIK